MFWIDVKYISFLSSRLSGYKKVTDTIWNCRCPICGDSQISTKKTRGYIYEKNGKFKYHCHNCGVHLSFHSFLKTIDETLFNEYLLEKMKEVNDKQKESLPKKPSYLNVDLDNLPGCIKFNDLPTDHLAFDYLSSRHIPSEKRETLYWFNEFKAVTNSIIPGKFDPITHEEGRLIIPLYDQSKSLIGYQGRTLMNDSKIAKYITIILDQNSLKFYGLSTLNLNKKIYAVEGAFDSMFLDNAVASLDGYVHGRLNKIHHDKSKFTVVYDNEPRNKEIVRNINKAIHNGYPVCIWPEGIKEKDINEMVINGLDPKPIIDTNTFSGLAAMSKLSEWKKI